MKILVQNRDERGSHFGGDMVHVHNYVKAMNSLGHSATYNPAFHADTTGVDIAFLFHINFGWTWQQYQNLKNRGVPYVLVAIFYPFKIETSIEQMKELIDGSKFVIALSPKEAEELKLVLGLTPEQFAKIKVFANGYDEEEFFVNNSWTRDYVISVGRYDGCKRHELVLEACKIASKPCVVIGHMGDRSYYEQLQKIYPENSQVFEGVPNDEMSEYYQRANICVSASIDERNSLTPIEAAACGCNIITSPGNRGNVFFGENLDIVEPTDSQALAAKILELWDVEQKSYTLYTWKSIVEEILKLI